MLLVIQGVPPETTAIAISKTGKYNFLKTTEFECW